LRKHRFTLVVKAAKAAQAETAAVKRAKKPKGAKRRGSRSPRGPLSHWMAEAARARAAKMSTEDRRTHAQKMAAARWDKEKSAAAGEEA
jgi:hypothetical protein